MLKKKFGLKINLYSLAMPLCFSYLVLAYIDYSLKTKSGSRSYFDNLGHVTEIDFKECITLIKTRINSTV